MRIYNYSEARQNLSSLLNTALNEDVIVTRKDGSRFKIVPLNDNSTKSPFDIDGIDTNIKTDEILDYIKESRRVD